MLLFKIDVEGEKLTVTVAVDCLKTNSIVKHFIL